MAHTLSDQSPVALTRVSIGVVLNMESDTDFMESILILGPFYRLIKERFNEKRVLEEPQLARSLGFSGAPVYSFHNLEDDVVIEAAPPFVMVSSNSLSLSALIVEEFTIVDHFISLIRKSESAGNLEAFINLSMFEPLQKDQIHEQVQKKVLRHWIDFDFFGGTDEIVRAVSSLKSRSHNYTMNIKAGTGSKLTDEERGVIFDVTVRSPELNIKKGSGVVMEWFESGTEIAKKALTQIT